MSANQSGGALRFVFVTLPNWILGGVMLTAIFINFANVIARYVFGQAFFWSEEVLVFLVIWGVFIAMAAIAYNGEHLNMDLVSSRLRGKWRTANNAFMAIVLLACCGLAAFKSFQVAAVFAKTGEVSVAAGVPMAVPYVALFAGFTLMLLGVLVRIRAYVSGKF